MLTVAVVVFLAAVQLPTPNPRRIAELSERLGDRSAWRGLEFASDRKGAYELLKQPIPECSDELYLLTTKTGDRKRYERVYYGRLSMLGTLCGAFRTTGDRRIGRRVVEILEAICGERSWTMPAHDLDLSNFRGTRLTIDLGSSYRALVLASVLSCLGDRLPKEVRGKVLAEMERRVFSPYRATNRDTADLAAFRSHGNWWFFDRSNWNAACHSAVVRAALAVLESREDRATFVEAAERAMPSFLESFLQDGYCTEGMGYWNYGFGNFLELADAVQKSTGGLVDFSALPGAKKVMEYGLSYTLDGKSCPVFADGGGGSAKRECLELGCRFWPDLRDVLKGKLPPRTFFPCAQVFIGRTPRIAIGMKGGNNAELHNHNDVGSWSLLVDGKVIAGDPGPEVYTARTFSKDRYVSDMLNSYGHPVPRVGGELQLVGRESQARVVRQDFGEARDSVVYDISDAYSMTRGMREAVVRGVMLDRDENTVTIVDRLAVDQPVDYESAVITPTAVNPLVPTVSGGAYHLEVRQLTSGLKYRHAVVFDNPVKSAKVSWCCQVSKSKVKNTRERKK